MINDRKRNMLSVLIVSWVSALAGQDMTAQNILDAIDANLNADTQIMTSRMIVHGRRASRTIVMKSWVVGTENVNMFGFLKTSTTVHTRNTRVMCFRVMCICI